MRLWLIFQFIVLYELVQGFKFINPPAFEETLDFSLNPIYPKGSLLNIKWSEPSENNTSLTLWQLNGTQFLQPFEYLTHNISGSVTSLDWTVQTTKDLSISHMFYFSLFVEGKTSSLGNSHYFNITDTEEAHTRSTSSMSTMSTGTTQLSTPTVTLNPMTSGVIPTNTADDPVPTASELSSGAKAGIGVGVSVAGIVLIGAALFAILQRRRRRRDLRTQIGFYGPVMNQQNPNFARGQVHELSGSRKSNPTYELPS